VSEKLTTQLFQLRELIDKYFPTDADLEAMILDFSLMCIRSSRLECAV